MDATRNNAGSGEVSALGRGLRGAYQRAQGSAFGLNVSLDSRRRNRDGGRWVGWGILAHNLRQIARRQAA
jgi:hypothetical protein